MRALLRMVAAFRNLFHSRQVESDLDAEIRAYVDAVTEERIAEGMTPEEARRTALAEFGVPSREAGGAGYPSGDGNRDDLAGCAVRPSHSTQIHPGSRRRW